MEKVNVYIDGPNLLGAVSQTLGRRLWVDPYKISEVLVDLRTQIINKIYYSETPYSQIGAFPETFKRQQEFFGYLFSYIQSKKIIHICGSYRMEVMRVPSYISSRLKDDVRRVVESLSWKRPIEKGGDVGLAIRLVRDAFTTDEFDHAVVITEDIDFRGALNIATANGKKVSIGYINNTHRNAKALRNACPKAGFIQITRREIERAVIEPKIG